ncbi:hypothetical protein PENSPDRAFT_670300 [Peniophora sp. CONT]|nr:hypothetical protein PENSPDRAFT_670300 [Peniophora sp. CONT]
MTRFLNPKRFSTISIDMPSWDIEEIALGMSVFTELRALRVVNPLHYLDCTPPTVLRSHSYTAFPFLNALAQTNPPFDDDRRNPSPLVLDVLWLVQQDYKVGYEEHTYSSWCKTIAYQLALTLCDSRPVAGAKPIGVLRIDYMPTIRDEERNAHEIFAEIAEVVKWSSREDAAE